LIKASTSLVLGDEAAELSALGVSEAVVDAVAEGLAEGVTVGEIEAEAAIDVAGVVVVALGCWHEATTNVIEIGSNKRLAKY